MNRSVRLMLVGLLTFAAGCAEQSPQPSEPSSIPSAAPATPSMLSYTVPSCTTQDAAQRAVDQLLPQLFAPGNARRGKAQGLSNDMEKARLANNTSLADIKADSLINFALQQYYAGQLLNQNSDLAGTQQRLVNFITYIYCFNGYSPLPDFDLLLNALNSLLIRNSTPNTIVYSAQKDAGVLINQGDVPTTVFGTYVSVVKTTNPLPTSLDWYGVDGYKAGAFEFVADPAVIFNNAVLTGVCISYDDAIVTSVADLRLAHTAPTDPAAVTGSIITTPGGSIEIGAAVSTTPLSLTCTPLPVASTTVFGRMLQQFASIVLPENLAAITKGGSVGTTVKTFSPFAVVDRKLNGTGSGPASPQFIPVGSTSVSAPASVAVKTRHDNTPITGIKVAFKPFAAFAPDSAPSAGAGGTATSTWTLVEGTNNGTAEPEVPLAFSSAVSFSATAVQETTLNFVGPESVPNGSTGTAYSTTFTASGGRGAGTYSWAVTGGSLPPGLSLSSSTGVLSGTPTATGTYSFTVTVTSGAQTASKTYSNVVIDFPPITAINLVFDVAPSKKLCYALNVAMSPGIRIKVTDQIGNLRSGVTVNLTAVTNNGANVALSPSSVVSSGGFASFGGPTINKTGGYALVASTGAPSPVASVTSDKFTISPSCP